MAFGRWRYGGLKYGTDLQPVASVLTTSWRIRQTVGLARSLSWRIRTLVGLARSLSWRIRVLAGLARSMSWRIRTLATKALGASWRIRLLVGVSEAVSWRIRVTAGRTLALGWRLAQTVAVAAVQALSWRIGSALLRAGGGRGHPIRQPLALPRVQVAAALRVQWSIRAAPLPIPIRVRASTGLQWRIRAGTRRPLVASWQLVDFWTANRELLLAEIDEDLPALVR